MIVFGKMFEFFLRPASIETRFDASSDQVLEGFVYSEKIAAFYLATDFYPVVSFLLQESHAPFIF